MKDKKNILYGVIGVMTLMLSIVGARVEDETSNTFSASIL